MSIRSVFGALCALWMIVRSCNVLPDERKQHG